MKVRSRGVLSRFAIVLLIGVIAAAGAACAPSQEASPTTGERGTERAPTRPNILRVAANGDVSIFHDRLKPVSDNPAGPYVNAGLADVDDKGVVRPILLERLPSQDDGTWVVYPDGTMKTLLTLRPDLKWQDGHPLTAADFAFAFRVYRDREMPLMTDVPERYMSNVVALDDRTLEISWQRVFVEAGTPAKNHLAPIPRHLLGDLYEQDKKAFLSSLFWSTEQYVGTGPFTVVNRDPGVRVSMRANPHFVFGKPSIDALELSVVPDRNTVVVRLLAGEVDFADWGDISVPNAALLGEQWKATGEGQVYTAMVVNRGLAFQYRDVPGHQKALLDVRVRQALMHAIDREALGRAETASLGGLSDTPFPPDHYRYPRIERAIAKYPLDLRRTEVLLNESGWTKSADGLFRNPLGEALDIEITASSDYTTSPVIIADFLKRAGVNAKPVLTPEGLDADAEYRASYPGATIESWTAGMYDRIWVSQLATPENGFRGRNRGSYVNPQLDALIDRLNTTLDVRTRDDIFVEMERLVSADVAVGHLYYQVRPAVALSSLKGITGYPYQWNVWEWRLS